jgi:hypothetical protein
MRREYYLEHRDEIREKQRLYYLANREAIQQKQAAYREAHRTKNVQYQRQYYPGNKARWRELDFKKRHGMSPEEWAAMWQAQDGRCYLCDDELDPDSRHTHVDHSHECCPQRKSCRACRRGLACSSCNAAIGYAFDDPERLRRMADALERAQASASERIGRSGEQLTLAISAP